MAAKSVEQFFQQGIRLLDVARGLRLIIGDVAFEWNSAYIDGWDKMLTPFSAEGFWLSTDSNQLDPFGKVGVGLFSRMPRKEQVSMIRALGRVETTSLQLAPISLLRKDLVLYLDDIYSQLADSDLRQNTTRLKGSPKISFDPMLTIVDGLRDVLSKGGELHIMTLGQPVG